MSIQARFRPRLLFRIACVLLGLFLLWVCLLRPIGERTGPQPQQIKDSWNISSLQAEKIDEASIAKIATSLFVEKLNVHSLLIERHGKLVAEYYQGGKDKSIYSLFATRQSFGPSDKHDIRSIGKSINSLLYGIALEQGKVPAVTSTLLQAFPQLQNKVTLDKTAIRIEDLLNMANGLQWHEGAPGINDEIRLFWKGDIAAYLLEHPMATPPNTAFNYNGGGTATLSELIRRGSGQSLEQFAQTNLFNAMAIHDVEWVQDLHGRAMAFNGLRMRPRDLLKFGRLVLNQGAWNGKQLVPKAWISTSMTPRFATDVRDYRYAYQWWHGSAKWQGKTIDWHAGFGNGGQRLYIIPALDMSVVTTAGAYGEMPTAIRVNDLVQEIIDSVRN